ncbi:TetR/AcrR family transcriptional regulator [Microbacterium sp. NPDC090014]|uniref:TetR/AcrR family transcriptional regulator n=1 Tax=Microbacterium sp. NPDC090014 TaxID=3364205 RepID=UPI00382C56CF
MPRITEARRTERRNQIAQAALRCFARQGFAGTSMADIITEAGLSSGSIYSHFDSKAELLRFAVSSVLEDRFTGMLDEVRDGGEIAPSRLLGHLLSEIGAEVAQAHVLLQVWAEMPRDAELAELMGDNLRKLRMLLTQALTPYIEAHQPPATATEAADAVLSALFGFVLRVAIDPQTPTAEIRQGVLLGFSLEPHPA